MTSSFAAVVPTPYFFAKFEHYLGMSSFTVAGLFQAFNEYAANHQLQVLVGTIGAIAVARVIVKYVFASKRLEKNVNDSSATRTLTSTGSVSFSSLPPPSMEDRVLGVLLGIAVGDAKGISYETLTKEEIAEATKTEDQGCYHKVHKQNKYIPQDFPVGKWTDDTQLTLAVARALISANGFDMDLIAKEHIKEFNETTAGWGSSTKEAVQRIAAGTHTWKNSGNANAVGNGVVMKLAPLSLWYAVKNVPADVQKKQIEQFTRMTHDNGVAVSCALVHNNVLQRIFNAKSVDALNLPAARLAFLNDILKDALAFEAEFKAQGADLLSSRVKELLANFSSLTDEKLISIARGGTHKVMDSLTVVYGIIAQRSPSFQSVLKAALLGGDTDSNASMVGAITGGLRGKVAIPQHYVDALVGIAELKDVALTFASVLAKK